jgi:hypothetical protein
VTDKALVIYCVGTLKKPHPLVPIARYERPYRYGDEVEDLWGPIRRWRDGDSIITVPEFERWVTDDDDDSRAAQLSLTKFRRGFFYRCELCSLDEQHYDFHARRARDAVLDEIADRGAVSAREFARRLGDQISRTRRK